MTPEQEAELFALLKKTCDYAEEHVKIAREYKAEVGDPLRQILYAGGILRRIIVWLVSVGLALIALREAWDGFLSKRFKP